MWYYFTPEVGYYVSLWRGDSPLVYSGSNFNKKNGRESDMARLYFKTTTGQEIVLDEEMANLRRRAIKELGFVPAFSSRGSWRAFVNKARSDGFKEIKDWIGQLGVPMPAAAQEPTPAAQ